MKLVIQRSQSFHPDGRLYAIQFKLDVSYAERDDLANYGAHTIPISVGEEVKNIRDFDKGISYQSTNVQEVILYEDSVCKAWSAFEKVYEDAKTYGTTESREYPPSSSFPPSIGLLYGFDSDD